MATITTEYGKLSSNKTRTVYLRIRSGKTEKRINTQIKVLESEISPRTKKIKDFSKARQIEMMRLDWETKINQLGIEALGVKVDAQAITSAISKKEETDFFAFAKNWLAHTSIKGKKNYQCMLNTFSSFVGKESLLFSDLTYTLLKEFENHLSKKPRAQSLYLGELRHLFREAMLEFNTEEKTIIKSDPFIRYKVPKQVMKKGVRALTLEELMKVYHYQGKPGSRSQLARDTFILSFCLMGMNSVDLFSATNYKNGFIKYNRTKTKDRRNDEAYIEVKVHPIIKPLMKKYAGTKTVFNFCSRYNDYEGFNKNLNIGLMYHLLIRQLTYLRAYIIIKLSDVYSLRQQSRETCHQKTGSNTIIIICKKLWRILLFSVTFYPLTSHTFHQTGKVFRLFINSKHSSFLVILG